MAHLSRHCKPVNVVRFSPNGVYVCARAPVLSSVLLCITCITPCPAGAMLASGSDGASASSYQLSGCRVVLHPAHNAAAGGAMGLFVLIRDCDGQPIRGICAQGGDLHCHVLFRVSSSGVMPSSALAVQTAVCVCG